MAAVRAQKAQDIEEEYNSTLRSQSKEMEALLETQEIIISPVLHNMMVHRRTSSEIELAMANYFDATTEALEMCRQLLQNIKDAQSSYQSMDSFLASISASHALDFAFTSNNPFCTTTRNNFRPIHDKYSCILQSIRSSHRRVGRKLKMVKAVKKLSRALVVMAGGAAAAAAFARGAPAVLWSPPHRDGDHGALKTWLAARASTKKPSSKTMSSLLQLQEQLDTAAKGTYVVGQDLDTVSNLVARLSDAIERENAMARWCAERADKRSSVLEMVNELWRSCSSSKRLTDELEEHVCLFLATIHRARNLVIQEISKKA
ncbi:unnamed protein product [Miscanthus lutarioriparius]|uniref:Uncharacterized protein n=1 Tax=Miscanthus lutarioriparius TaxID=422564 RepID=A0A811R254_9POAL|nr:unnamed protein product [Miscanthus lutarioriparius]